MIRLYDVDKSIVCPKCGKPSQCMVAPDGTLCICWHNSEGAIRKTKGGWLHALKPGEFTITEQIKSAKQHKSKPDVNWDLLHHIFLSSIPSRGEKLELGITSSTLALFGMGFDKETGAWTFPMRNEHGQIIGIHKRYSGGTKAVHKGSTPGLFIPDKLIPVHNMILVCEGLSDAAIATDLGFGAIGKFNWSTGEDMIPQLISNMEGIGLVVIVSDVDEGGRYGSQALQNELRKIKMDSIIIYPTQAKDLREYFLRFFLTHRQLCDIIRIEIKKQIKLKGEF